MGKDLKDRLARAGTTLVPAPLKAAIELMRGTLAPPDLADAALDALLTDVVRLHDMISKLAATLGSEITTKMDPIETLELITQTFENMERTAYSERRQLMANVLVNGLNSAAAGSTSPPERRFFVRAIADLDIVHVDLLRKYEALHGTKQVMQLSPLEQAARHELETRSLIEIKRASAYGGNIGIQYERITDLGRGLLIFLRSPE